MHPCIIGKYLLSNLLFECVNKVNGCMVSIGLSDTHSCSYWKYTCGFCETSFANLDSIRVHMEEDHQTRMSILIGEDNRLSMYDNKVILEDRVTNDLFLLRFEEGALFLQHMVGDEPRKYNLYAYCDDDNNDDNDYWAFCGYTSSFTSPVEESLKLPSPFAALFAQDKPAICELEITNKTSPKEAIMARFDGVSLEDMEEYLKCIICYKLVKHPVYHCVIGHPTCGRCIKKITNPKKCGLCSYCSNKMIQCCVATHILPNCQFSCFNRECYKHLTYSEIEEHAERCNETFSCPMCLTDFSNFDLDRLTEHLTVHEPNSLKTNEPNRLTLQAGSTLLKEVAGDYYVILFESGKISVHHLPQGIARTYSIVLRNKELTWEFQGQTTQVEKRPRLCDRCFTLPQSARSDRDFPIEVTLHISHWG